MSALIPEQPQPIFKVSEFNEMVNLHLARLGEVTIEGEISRLTVSQGKWLYITIKDEIASVEIFGTTYGISGWQALEEGMMVHVFGAANLYQKTGRFSVTAERITPAGEGSLKIAFEKLQAQLAAEGLFALERKRVLPRFPQRIGLITAVGSQAYNDFIKVLKNRLGGLHITFVPSPVQGSGAPEGLIKAIRFLNSTRPDLEALVICRGGGSLEDLQAFNDEQVVRAIFASKIPTIVGVGHEGDVSLADLVADVRASTPSNAAEILVPERQALMNEVDAAIRQIQSQYMRALVQAQNTAAHAFATLHHTLESHVQEMYHTIELFMKFSETMYQGLRTRQLHVDNIAQKLRIITETSLEKSYVRVDTLNRLLQSLDYTQVLKRGFSITRNSGGALVRSVSEVTMQTELETTLQDGTIYSQVNKKVSPTVSKNYV